MIAASTHSKALSSLENRPSGRSRSRLRIAQIRTAAKLLLLLDRVDLGRVRLSQVVRAVVPPAVLRASLGYRWVFGSLAEAHSAAKRVRLDGHDHPDNVRKHVALATQARPSDYPVLFHLANIIGECRSVLDLGGNVGNLFYNYSRYLDFPADLLWTVCDVPEVTTMGSAIAAERGETRLRFDGSFEDMNGADLLLASGCIHYFEQPLAEMIAGARIKPTHVIVNRTPLISGKSTVTVQDAGSYLVACKLFNKDELVAGMVGLGYEIVDTWEIPELSLRIPSHPELSVTAYSGFYFKRT
ncbi:MAG TPA: TIGR04325 family methyltransferase [Bryobacteraceae bacterium]|nr:TIGR04325 family methyltransferase [Bryobacteraceae bacterium]